MNAEESAALAQAFVSEAFLEAQVDRKPGDLYLMRCYYIVCAWTHRLRSFASASALNASTTCSH